MRPSLLWVTPVFHGQTTTLLSSPNVQLTPNAKVGAAVFLYICFVRVRWERVGWEKKKNVLLFFFCRVSAEANQPQTIAGLYMWTCATHRCHRGRKTGGVCLRSRVGERCSPSKRGPKQRRSHHLPAFANHLLNEEKSNTEILITCRHLPLCREINKEQKTNWTEAKGRGGTQSIVGWSPLSRGRGWKERCFVS